MKNGKKLILSLGVILVFVAYSWQQRHDTSAPIAASGGSANPSQRSNEPTVTPSTPTPSTPSSNATKYKDGQYTGSVDDAFYGNIQVQVSISGGKITDVQFLQYPNDRQNSIFINQQAMPILRSEAIKAQNAHVDIVSGATDTSQAFVQSLTDALNQAV